MDSLGPWGVVLEHFGVWRTELGWSIGTLYRGNVQGKGVADCFPLTSFGTRGQCLQEKGTTLTRLGHLGRRQGLTWGMSLCR